MCSYIIKFIKIVDANSIKKPQKYMLIKQVYADN